MFLHITCSKTVFLPTFCTDKPLVGLALYLGYVFRGTYRATACKGVFDDDDDFDVSTVFLHIYVFQNSVFARRYMIDNSKTVFLHADT